jgi:membrane fusion protein (multidrug efflux system)
MKLVPIRKTLSGLVPGLGLLLLFGCSRARPTSADDESADQSPAVVAEVTVTRVARADIRSTLAVSGTLAALPNQDVKVSSLVPGRVARMEVGEGDSVKSGALLAKIDDRSFLDQIQQAEAGVAQAKASLENARLNRERNENLLGRGIAARRDVEDARMQANVAEATVRQAEATLALARLQLARTEVRAPLDGVVVKRLVSVGEQVDGTAAQPILDVAALGKLELFGNVPALYLPHLHVGDQLTARSEAFLDHDFKGRVVAVSPAVDASTNVGTVRIRFPNPGQGLKLGMFLTAQVPIETHLQTLVVPPQAVYRDAKNQAVVYRLSGDTAEAVPVKLGLETSQQVELLSGVEAGDTIILTGGYGLGERAKVRVKP